MYIQSHVRDIWNNISMFIRILVIWGGIMLYNSIFAIFMFYLMKYIATDVLNINYFKIFSTDCYINAFYVSLKTRSVVDCGRVCSKTLNCTAFIRMNSTCGLLGSCLEDCNSGSLDQTEWKLYCLSSKRVYHYDSFYLWSHFE